MLIQQCMKLSIFKFPLILFFCIFFQPLLIPIYSQNISDNKNQVDPPKEIQENKEETSEVNTGKKRIEEFEYFIQWEEVEGNNGYNIQVMDSNEKLVVDTIVKTNSYEFVIPLGKYKIRIAALNKFGKPSEWTKWDSFTVDKETAKPKRNLWKKTKMYIPCLGFYDTGRIVAGSGCLGWYAGLGLLFNSEKKAGDLLAQKNSNDPMTLSFLSYNQPLLLSLKMFEDKQNDRKKYEQHQKNQRSIGILAVLSYAAYVFYIQGNYGTVNKSAYQIDIRAEVEWMIQPNYSQTNLIEYKYSIFL
jgi:hypothetical protein